MGIGVYESREYVRELGGEMQVSSEVNKGTRFRICLPATIGPHKERLQSAGNTS